MEKEKHVLKGNVKDKKATGSVIGGSVSGSGESNAGVSTSWSASGDILHGEANGNLNIRSDVKYDNNGLKSATLIDVSVSGKGSVAKGEVSGSYGYAKGKIEGSVGTVGGNVGANVTLYEDGEFRPHVEAGGKITADVAKGSISGSVGTDEYDVHAKASGELGHAEARGTFKAGVIEKEDSNGNTTTQVGVDWDAGAEAYLAKGSISGGFTVMGIKVDAAVEGKAGGAGATASGSVTTGGLSGGLSLGAILGLGVKVSVDWSGFKWPFSKDDNVPVNTSQDSGAVSTSGPINLCVYPKKLDSCAKTLSDVSKETARLIRQVESIEHNLSVKSLSMITLKSKFTRMEKQLTTQKDALNDMSELLTGISKQYKETEKQVIDSGTL